MTSIDISLAVSIGGLALTGLGIILTLSGNAALKDILKLLKKKSSTSGRS